MTMSVCVRAAIILPLVGAGNVDLCSVLPRGCCQPEYYKEGCTGTFNLKAATYTASYLQLSGQPGPASLEIHGSGIGQTIFDAPIGLAKGMWVWGHHMNLTLSNLTFSNTITAGHGGALYANGCEFNNTHNSIAVNTEYVGPVYFKDCVFRSSLLLDSRVCAEDSVLTDGAVVDPNYHDFLMATCATSADQCGFSCPSGYKCIDVAERNPTGSYTALGYKCEAMAPSATGETLMV